MVIANYVYEKVGAKRKKVIHYENALPVDKMFGWDDMGHFKVDQYILMHSVIYRTQLIKDCGLELPKHTFYVDNVFVFEPLPYVKKMYYINTNFYRYFIGRDDQSVNEKVMISRIDQQLRVTRRLIDSYLSEKPENEKCRKYMMNIFKNYDGSFINILNCIWNKRRILTKRRNSGGMLKTQISSSIRN